MLESRPDLKRLLQVAAAGGVSGAGISGLTALLSGGDPKAILRRAILGGVIGGVGAPTSQVAGEAVLGSPRTNERNPYTRRGAIGGAILGGLAGLAGTAALSGKLPLSRLGSFGEKAEKALNVDNALLNRLRNLSGDPSKMKQALGLAGGAGAGALAGLHFGADEGMGQDVIQNEIESLRDRRRRRQLLAEGIS